MERRRGYRIDTYDRMLDVKDQHQEEWRGECPYCHSTRLAISPAGMPFRQHTIHDFSDLSLDIRKYYYNLPVITDAIMKCLDGERGSHVLVECLDCGVTTRGFLNKPPSLGDTEKVFVNRQKLRRYLNLFYGVDEVMRV